MTDTPPTPAAVEAPPTPCHTCPAAALLVYRLTPWTHDAHGARSIWDQTARDVAACGLRAHQDAAKAQGTVIGARALSDNVSIRVVAP